MKRLSLFILAVVLSVNVWGNEGKRLSATFGYSTFYIPNEKQSYVEMYMSYDAWNMNFMPIGDGQYKASVETIIQVKSGDSTVYVKKYTLNSPAITNPEETDFNFLDLQRFALKTGIYDLILSVRDVNSSQEASVVEEKLLVDFAARTPALSTVQIMSSVKKTTTENIFSRMGYDMQPYVSDYIPESMAQLSFYYEIYCIDEEVGFDPIITYAYFEESATGYRATDVVEVKKHKSSNFIPVFTTLDISRLPSGKYDLVVEVHNKKNENILYKRVTFYRSAPSLVNQQQISLYDSTFVVKLQDENILNHYIDALYPIASAQELMVSRQLVQEHGLKEKQAFFYKFWAARDPLNPEGAWLKYRQKVDYVDRAYKYMNVPGYKTDRGRVYLQYGPPDFIRDEKNFVSAMKLGTQGHIYYLPYQLWRYNKLETDDQNRCFIFWDEFRNGAYMLLNSNARGEVRDPLWERRLCGQQLEEGMVGEVGEQFERGY